ncbi:MAG: PfkB family carbohydrate kinase [bacterium]|nr:PfkB family carbohydrate kinase [bacterium]
MNVPVPTKDDSPRVVVVGSVALDTVTTPAGTRAEMLGGSAVHFAVSASFFTRVGLVGVVGDDFPREHLAFLAARNIDLRGLDIVRGAKTFRWTGSYLRDLNAADTHCTALNVFADFSPQLPAAYRQAPVLFLANIAPALQMHVLEQMSPSCYRICDTMNLWITQNRTDVEEVFRRVHIAILNDGEARMFTGKHNLIAAGRAILAYGVEYCVIKKGEHGAMIFGQDGFFVALPAYPVEDVVDPTGAGDSFAGGFVGYLSACAAHDQMTIRAALRHGIVMGSFNVADFSCDRFRTLTVREIEQRLADYNAKIV